MFVRHDHFVDTAIAAFEVASEGYVPSEVEWSAGWFFVEEIDEDVVGAGDECAEEACAVLFSERVEFGDEHTGGLFGDI